MDVRLVAPSKELAPFVSSFSIVETTEVTERTLLPDTGIVLGVRYAGAATLLQAAVPQPVPGNAITGMRSTARRMRTSAGGGMVVAKLRDMGAHSFFDGPLHHLFGATRPLEEHWGAADVTELSRSIAHAEGDQERVAIFEHFLLARCTGRPDRVVSEALRAIHADPGGVRIATVARNVGLSQDAFEKRFRRTVGMPPKAFASLIRFRRAIDAYPRAPATLTELAFGSGFYDQSHFIRRFRSVTGAPPGRFLGSAEYCG
jgi:AraC-like DNA-binding protein